MQIDRKGFQLPSEMYVLAAVLLMALSECVHAASPSPDELAEARRWTTSHLEGGSVSTLPFSFTYGGKPSAELLKDWQPRHVVRTLDAQRSEHTLRFTDPTSGLELRCVAIEYHDFPSVEWTLYFKNTGRADTAILENVRALDLAFGRGGEDEFLMHHCAGASSGRSDYAPLETPLAPKTTKRFAPVGGRPANGNWPYFNLQWGSRGMIVAIGWPGQWAAEFVRDEADGIRIRAGQELTHFKLLPGEEVRTPLVVLQFWQGKDWIDSQNVWRRWMMTHSMPKPGGKLPPPIALAGSHRFYAEMTKANERNQIMFLNRYLAERLKIDYWWMDAGWYPCNGKWQLTGTWEVDTARFPKGFKPISDHAHANGIKILVWFEPERVRAGTWLTKNHPEWIIGGVDGGLLNLGNPAARNWLTNHVDKLLTEQGIDLYRQDFNMDPLGHWRRNDSEDRQGITEIKHVTGYLAYWDELLRRHPDMLIDSCASGGRRNELEAMRRAVPLWRSDFVYDPAGMQCLTYGISLWLPYHGTGNVACAKAGYYAPDSVSATPVEPYAFWSTCCPANNFVFDVRARDMDYEALRRLFARRERIAPNYFGDYYPLTPYSQQKDAWMAWQFNRPAARQGMVQAFRRATANQPTASLKLRGLDSDARYNLTDLESNRTWQAGGLDLMDKGLNVSIPARPGTAVIVYEPEP